MKKAQIKSVTPPQPKPQPQDIWPTKNGTDNKSGKGRTNNLPETTP